MFKKYVCVKQYDITDCGAACLATVTKQHGLKLSITKIREIAGTDKQGTNAYGMVEAAKQLGFSAKAMQGELSDLVPDLPMPLIAHTVMEGSLMHYVVVHKITDKGITVADPAKGLSTYTVEDFSKVWTGVIILLTPTVHFEKGDETVGIVKRFYKLLLPQKNLMIHVYIASLLSTALGLLGAFYFKLLMDDIIPYGLKNSLMVVSIGMLMLTVFQILIGVFRSHLLLYLSQKIDIPLILGYYNHVLELPMSFFGTRKVGEILSRFQDASKIRVAISSATLTVMIDVLMALGGGVLLYTQNATLFGIACVMLLLYGVIVFAFNKPLKEENRKLMEESSQLTSYLVESLNGIQTIKAYHAEGEAQLKTEFHFIKTLKRSFTLSVMDNARSAMTSFVGSIGGNLILWIGALFIIKGDLSLGELFVFNSLMAYFVDPVKNLINLQTMMQTALVASDRLGEILDLELERDKTEQGKLKPEKLDGSIVFEAVDFRYGTRELVINNLDLSINPRERIALVGESGSGKTTLIKLLMRFYQPEKGNIRFDGHSIQDINIDALRDRIAYVPQETFLFSGTIEDNMKLGQTNVSFAEIVDACKRAKAHDFIEKLPLRYQTRLEENGSNLSGGQRQRLSIARAILKAPDILILDEATSNLDSSTERAIEATIQELGQSMTTIIIAHRLSTIMSCDKIFVLGQGSVIETGTHHELMDQQGAYYALWKDQLPSKETILTEGESA